MAKGGTKFGTFGGVFVPSILTILGVIMYLRLPWVIGNGGLWMTIGIILAAHVVSVTTGLSISSIATDKKVGAGGPYYIVSRSLGLPIGGTLGIALFIGLSFSVSLYIIGFSESFLATIGVGTGTNAIRLCGTITIIAVTTVTLISTAFAIKTQYLILTAIGLSLIAILLGGSDPTPASPVMDVANTSNASFAVLFGIFFPAVTGFTAGVNMSGDLKDPKRSIPVGTMAAIGVGLVTYLGLAFFLAYRIDRDTLLNDTQALYHIAWFGPFVLAGIWGATISSAMGSILGAPRILQALSVDRVTPRFFAHGHGRANEPRRALVLAFAIAEAGILIGELDLIARIVSMFFMATYGFLNLSCAIESWASTDFRPSFRIPKTVSIIGFVTVAFLMFNLDIVATIGSLVLFAGLFLWLKRRELTLESGDTWAGVWYSMVRTNLTRLTRTATTQRDYRPNVLCFTEHESVEREAVLELGETLVTQRGMLSDVELRRADGAERGRREPEDAGEHIERPQGIFHYPVRCEDPFEAMGAMILYHGFPGLEPNTTLLSFSSIAEEPQRFVRIVDAAVKRDLNILLAAPKPGHEMEQAARRKVDLWWAPGRGNFSYLLALARYLTASDEWNLAEVRFLLINDNVAKTETLYRTATRLCAEGRLEASVKVLNNTLADRSYEDWVRRESAEVDLVVLNLPNDVEELREEGSDFCAKTTELIEPLANVLIVLGNSTFPEVLHAVGESRMAEVAATPMGEDTLEVVLPKLELPPVPELANETMRVSARMDAVAAEFEEGCLAPAYRVHKALVEQALALVDRCFEQLRDAANMEGHRQRKGVSRVHNTFLQQASKILSTFQSEDLAAVQETLEGRIEWYLGAIASIRDSAPGSALTIYRGVDPSVESEGGEEQEQTRPSLRTRVRKTVVPLEGLLNYHIDYGSTRVLNEALVQAVRHGSLTTIKLAKALNSVRISLSAISGRVRTGELSEKDVATEQEGPLRELRALLKESDNARRSARRTFLKSSRQLSIELGWDFNRPDLQRWVKRERRVPREARELQEGLLDVPQMWIGNELLLSRRSELEIQIAAFQSRLAVIAERTKDTLSSDLKGGVASELEELLAMLQGLLEKTTEKGRVRFEGMAELPEETDIKRIIDDLVKKTQAATSSLPDAYDTLDEDSITQLEEDPFNEVESVSVPVRRRVEFLVQAELVGRLQQGLTEAVTAQRRAISVGRDVLRLITFNINDLIEEEEEDDAFRERLVPIIVEGIGRLQSELEKVRTFEPQLTELLERQLDLVVERTDAYAITGSADGLKHYVSAEGARKQALTRYQQLVGGAQVAVKRAMMWVFYQHSTEMVRMHQLQAGLDQQETLIDGVLRFVRINTPRQTVLSSLPFYYQQPFLGKTRISSDFWIGREEEMATAATAITHARLGTRGAIIVTGERNSGKSALCRSIANAHFKRDRIHHVLPPPGGSIDPKVFAAAVESELGAQKDVNTIFANLPEGSVVVFHDLELWWQRSADGLAIIEQIQRLIEDHSGRCLIILNLGIRALRFIRRLLPLNDQALAIIECGPLEAKVLEQIVMLRHRSTGLSLRLGLREEEELSDWRLARLFARHFDFSGGIVGVALQSWITHIESVDKRTVEILTPGRTGSEVLHELPMEWVALLLEIVLHNQVTPERLAALTQISSDDLRHQLKTLTRTGLVTQSKQDVIELNRFVEHMVTAHLRERGLLV